MFVLLTLFLCQRQLNKPKYERNTNNIGQQLFHILFTLLSSPDIHTKYTARAFLLHQQNKNILFYVSPHLCTIHEGKLKRAAISCLVIWLSKLSIEWSRTQIAIRLNIHKNFTLDTCRHRHDIGDFFLLIFSTLLFLSFFVRCIEIARFASKWWQHCDFSERIRFLPTRRNVNK